MNVFSGLLLLTLAAVWGGSFFFAEIALAEVPPLSITLHRVFWAAPLLMIIVRWQGIAFPRCWRIWCAYAVMGALNNAIPFSLIFFGQTQIEGGLASILNGTTAIFGAVVAGVLLADEYLSIRKILGAAIGMIGIVVIMGWQAITHLQPSDLAQIAVLGAGLSYAFASVWGKTRLRGQPPLMNALGMLMASSVLMIPLVLIHDGLPSLNLSPGVWMSLLALSVLSTSIAYILYFEILFRAGAANLMLVTLLIPPFAIGLGAVFLGERLDTSAWIGFAIIALGLVVTDGRLWRKFLSKVR